jgi:hypothetical protein
MLTKPDASETIASNLNLNEGTWRKCEIGSSHLPNRQSRNSNPQRQSEWVCINPRLDGGLRVAGWLTKNTEANLRLVVASKVLPLGLSCQQRRPTTSPPRQFPMPACAHVPGREEGLLG